MSSRYDEEEDIDRRLFRHSANGSGDFVRKVRDKKQTVYKRGEVVKIAARDLATSWISYDHSVHLNRFWESAMLTLVAASDSDQCVTWEDNEENYYRSRCGWQLPMCMWPFLRVAPNGKIIVVWFVVSKCEDPIVSMRSFYGSRIRLMK